MSNDELATSEVDGLDVSQTTILINQLTIPLSN